MLRAVRAASSTVRLVLAIGVGIVALVLLAAGGLAWRLEQGPLEVTALVRHLAPLIDPGVTVGRVTVGLEQREGERVLQLDGTGLEQAADAEQPAQSIRHAMVVLPVASLLIGRLLPEDVIADGLRLHVARSAQSEPEQPGVNIQRLLSKLRHAVVSDAQISVGDGALGVTWQVSDASASLDRQPDGSLAAHATGTASVGDVSATLTAEGSEDSKGTSLHVTTSPVSPAALAHAVPQWAALSALDAAVAIDVQASFDAAMQPLRATVHAQSGPGTALLPAKGGSSPDQFEAMSLDMDATPVHATLRALRVMLRSPSGGPSSTLTLSGTADRANGRFQAHLAVDIDHVAFADLPTLWPERVATNARTWLTTNITAGIAHDAHFTFTLVGAETGDDVDLTEAGGSLTGDDVTTWWLRPVPPLEHGHAVLVWQSPDALLITVTGARQGALVVPTGSVRITGLNVKDQMCAIDADIAGPLGDLFTLLKNPRLKLLSAHPVSITAASGSLATHLSIQLPLDQKVTVDQVVIHATGQVANAHLGAIAAGRDLDNGQLTLDVTNDGLAVSGTAQFDHMPGKLAVNMDFRTGPPSQVTTHAAITLRATERDAKAAGLNAIGLNAGAMSLALDYAERRDAGATIKVNADLKEAGFATPLGWTKVVGTSGHFEGQAILSHGKLVGLEGLHAEAPGLSIQARSDMVGGVPDVVHVERGEIGRSSATGTVSLPRHDGEPYRVTLSGPRLDLEGSLKGQTGRGASVEPAPSKPGTPYAVDLRFQQVLIDPSHSLGPVSLIARGDGTRLTSARLVTGGAEQLQADLVSAGRQRKLWATAADLGALLHDTDLASEITGGRLTLDGTFDDRSSSSPFSGTMDLRNFQVHGAPVLGKVLQGMTLYGLVDVLSGPGLVFDRFDAPFRLDGSVLDVGDARAYSSSLGVTATGALDFGRKQVALTGTIVPAYFFNSLPGRVPLLGRLFSPEKGGGVFAATFGLHGSLLDPNVSINPLSALTPGFTRRLFDLFK